MDASDTLRTLKTYDAAARLYDLRVAPMELAAFGRLRPRLWQEIEGELVLEIGTGTGKNVEHYPAASRVVAIDISRKMVQRAARRAGSAGRPVDLLVADAQRLPFRDGVFASAAATCVFCSVPDAVAGLREAGRVTAADGRVHLLEHVRGAGVLGRLMDLLNPLVARMSGANINRDTVGNLERAGITADVVESRYLGIVKLIRGRARQAPATPERDGGRTEAPA